MIFIYIFEFLKIMIFKCLARYNSNTIAKYLYWYHDIFIHNQYIKIFIYTQIYTCIYINTYKLLRKDNKNNNQQYSYQWFDFLLEINNLLIDIYTYIYIYIYLNHMIIQNLKSQIIHENEIKTHSDIMLDMWFYKFQTK